MIKNKRFVSIMVMVTLIITVAGVYAAGRIYTNKSLDGLKEYVDNSNLSLQVVDSEQQVLESSYNEAYRQYNESRKQTALYQNQLDRLNFDKSSYSKKKEQQQMIEKYQLQVEYYNVCLLIKQLSLGQGELELVEKQIAVELEKLNQGNSTQLAVDDLNSRRRIVQDKITNLNQSIDTGKNALKARLNETANVQFDPSFAIPSSVDSSDTYSLSTLRIKCEDNNLSLLQANAYIGFHNTLISSLKACAGEGDYSYGTTISERSRLQADANVLKQKLDAYVEQQYNAFKQSLARYSSAKEREDILSRQLEVLKTRYDNGDISELQYLSDKFQVLKELNDGYGSIVGKINAVSLINLVENGIMLQS